MKKPRGSRSVARRAIRTTGSELVKNLETGALAGRVVAKRLGLIASGVANPASADFFEIPRMVTEKMIGWPAYGVRMGFGFIGAVSKFTAGALWNLNPLSRRARPTALIGLFVKLMGDMVETQRAAAEPIRTAVAKNATRLGKRKA